MVAHWPLIGRREELSIIERILGEASAAGCCWPGRRGWARPGWPAKRSPPPRRRDARRGGRPLPGRWPRSRSVPWRTCCRPPRRSQPICRCCSRPGNGWPSRPEAGAWCSASMTRTCWMTPPPRCSFISSSTASPSWSPPLPTGVPAPGPVTALWKEGVAERLEIQALARSEVSQLIEAALGGPVEGLTRERLWQLSRGNILYLRELVRGGRQTGDLGLLGGHVALGRAGQRPAAAGRADPGPYRRPAACPAGPG